MEASSPQSRVSRALGNKARAPQYSKDTQDMLRCEMMMLMMMMMIFICVHGEHTCMGLTDWTCTFRLVYNPCFFLFLWCSVMMQELNLTSLQRKQINECLKSKTAVLRPFCDNILEYTETSSIF